MMLGKKDQNISESKLCSITKPDKLREFEKIKKRLDYSEVIQIMTNQSRIKSGRSAYSLLYCKSIKIKNFKTTNDNTTKRFQL